jgi:DNA-binding GntR family transcriptional regulator
MLRAESVNNNQGELESLEDLWEAASVDSSAGDAVYATLRKAIVHGRLRPGDRLSEEALARQFRVSRTPVREAVLKLEAERLATRIPRRGLVVRGSSVAEVLEVFTLRVVLDGLAARLAAEQALPGEIAELRWLNQRLADLTHGGDTAALSDLHFEFHSALCRAAHNNMLPHFTEQTHDFVRRFGESALSDPERGRVAIAEHEEIIAAIEARNAARAEQAAAAHMEHARQVRIKMLQGESGQV